MSKILCKFAIIDYVLQLLEKWESGAMVFSSMAFLLEFVQVVVVVMVSLVSCSRTTAKIIDCCVNQQTCLALSKVWVGPMCLDMMKSLATMMQVGSVDGVSKDNDNGASDGEFKQDGSNDDTNNLADLPNELGTEGMPYVLGLVENDRDDDKENMFKENDLVNDDRSAKGDGDSIRAAIGKWVAILAILPTSFSSPRNIGHRTSPDHQLLTSNWSFLGRGGVI